MNYTSHRDGGFSLVEIMVALFIMALASAMVVMVMPSRPDALNAEVDQFETLLTRAQDQAISRGQAQGIRVETNAYTVYTRINGRWMPLEAGSHRVSGGVTISVLGKTEAKSVDTLPQIVMDASGIVSGPDVRFVKGARMHDFELPGRSAR